MKKPPAFEVRSAVSLLFRDYRPARGVIAICVVAINSNTDVIMSTSSAKSSSRSLAKYNLQKTKNLSDGQWVSVIQKLTNIDPDFLKLSHGPCPKCGGKDRWRLTSVEIGSGICNQCGKFGDGIAVIQWYLGISFIDALKLVAECVGVEPDTISTESKQSQDPAKNLEFIGQKEAIFSVFCMKKKGVKPESLLLVDAQYAIYRKKYPVIAIPIKGNDGETLGYCIYGATGKDLPIWEKGNKQPVEWRKIKITSGSKPGWIGPTPKPTDKSLWKTEGPSCLLSLLSLGLPEGHSVCCNAFGAEENPATTPLMLERFRDAEEVFVVHDCDKSGQRGATEVTNENGTSRPGWAPAIANFAKQVRNYVLPWPMVDSHGQDLRDLIIQRLSEGLTDGEIYQHILANARLAPVVKPIAIKISKGTLSTAVGKNKIANGKAEAIYENGKKSTIYHATPILDIAQSIFAHSGGWPKRSGNDLFVIQNEKIRVLKKPSSLFAWLRETVEVNWMQAANLPTKEEIFEIVGSRCERFDTVESYPHFPRIENVYYTCEDRAAGNGKNLDQFLDFFCPSSAIDRQLLLAAIVTTFWGGPPGVRPAFQFAATTGQGAGKTTTAATIAKLSGGSIDFDQSAKRDEITKRLINSEAGGRVALLDNIKAQMFSSASFESLITAKSFSGWQLYLGDIAKPNYVTFFVTFNSANFSRDMAQRLVSIVLKDSIKKANWQTDVDSFLKCHRNHVIDDIKAFFDRPKKELPKHNRWAHWQGEIISRLEDPESIIDELQQREGANDGDAKAACDVLDYVADYLMDFRYETPYRVHIGFPELSRIVCNAIGSPHTPREAGLLIDRFISSGLILNMKRNQCHTFGKGFLYWSLDGGSHKVAYDLSDRIEIRETENDNAREKRRAEARRGAFL